MNARRPLASLIAFLACFTSLRSEVLFESPDVVHLRYQWLQNPSLTEVELYLIGPDGEQQIAASDGSSILGTNRFELNKGLHRIVGRALNIFTQKRESYEVEQFQKSNTLWGQMEYSEAIVVKTETLDFESVTLKPGLTLSLGLAKNLNGAFNCRITGGDLVDLWDCDFRPTIVEGVKRIKATGCDFKSLVVDPGDAASTEVVMSGCAFTGATALKADTIDVSQSCFTAIGPNLDQEATVVFDAEQSASLSGSDCLGGPVQFKGAATVSVANNVLACALWMNGSGPFPRITGNSLLWKLSLPADAGATFVSMPDNYWGGRRGPTYDTAPGVGWLDEYGRIDLGRLRVNGTVRETGAFNVSGVETPRPFPKVYAANAAWGQNVIGPYGSEPYVRKGRSILVCYDVRCTVESLPGARYFLLVNGREVAPTNQAFVARCDYGAMDTSPNNQDRTLNFRLDPSQEDQITIQLCIDTSRVQGYAPNPGRLNLSPTTIQQYGAYARPLRIAVVPVRITAPGFTITTLLPSSRAACVRKFREDLLALTPLREDEICMEERLVYNYTGTQWGWRSFFPSGYISDLVGEMNNYRLALNMARPDEPYDLVVALLPGNALGGADGAGLVGVNAVVVDEQCPGAFAHELAHVMGAADSYSEGWLGYGATSGRSMANHTAFHPELLPSYTTLPGTLIVPTGIRHFPAGVDVGNANPDVADLMGSKPNRYWILKETHRAFGQYFGAMLGYQPAGLSLQSGKPLLAQAAAPGTYRRIWVEGTIAPFPLAGSAYPLSGAIPESVSIADVTDVLPVPMDPGRGGTELNMKFVAFNAMGMQVFSGWGRLETLAGQNARWQQTFDVPTNAVSYELVQTDVFGNPVASLFKRVPGPAFGARLYGPANGSALGSKVPLRWETTISDSSSLRVRHLLFLSTDGQQTWQPIPVSRFENALDLETDTLPSGSGLALRLLSSDGFQTTHEILSGLSLGNRPPTAKILGPQNGDAGATNSLWTLVGDAMDTEDGSLAASEWTSSRDGLLGTNAVLSGVLLSPGVHQLSFLARDKEGLTSKTSVQVTVTSTGLDWKITPEDLRLSVPGARQTPSTNLYVVYGTTNLASLTVRNQGVTNSALVSLYLQPPTGPEQLIGTQTLSWAPFEEANLQAAFNAEKRGRYRFRAYLKILAYPEQALDNNQQVWEVTNQPPVARGTTVVTSPGRTAIQLEGFDLSGDPISYTLEKQPTHGTLSGTPPTVYYTSASEVAEDELSFRVNDGELNSVEATVRLILLPSQLPPKILSPGSLAAKPGVPLGYSIEVLHGATHFSAEGLPEGLVLDPLGGVLSGVPSTEGTYSLLLKASSAKGEAQASLTLRVAKWSSDYSDWVTRYQLSGPAAEYDADPDVDGLDNWNEYALGLSPAVPDPGQKPSVAIEDGFLTLHYRQPKGGTGNPGFDYQKQGILYRVETLRALGTEPWTSHAGWLEWMPGQTIDLGDGYERAALRWPIPAGVEPTRFWRVVVKEAKP